jgi:hypothetical protein
MRHCSVPPWSASPTFRETREEPEPRESSAGQPNPKGNRVPPGFPGVQCLQHEATLVQ